MLRRCCPDLAPRFPRRPTLSLLFFDMKNLVGACRIEIILLRFSLPLSFLSTTAQKGLECQRPKRQNSSDDIEVLSTGTPLQQESPELYRKGTTPSDLTPDDSPLQSFPASPSSTPPLGPSCRNKSAHFSRQVSVDEERGGEIQMLLEGRGGDYLRPNSWSDEKVGGTRGVRSGTLRSGQLGSASIPEDYRGRSGGHKHSASNHKQRERWTDSPATVSWTSHHRSHNHSSGSSKLLELDEEKMSNYEMEMKPLMRMDSYMQEIHTQKRHYSKGGPCRSMADDHRGEDRGFGVQRLRSKSQNKENFRPASSAEPTVQKLENLRFGDKAEPRLLRWDLTFSPPQKSLPVALESEEDNGDALKSSTVSRRNCVLKSGEKPGAELLWYCSGAEREVALPAELTPELPWVCAVNPPSSLLPSCVIVCAGSWCGGFSADCLGGNSRFFGGGCEQCLSLFCNPVPGPTVKIPGF